MLWREGDKTRCFHMKDVYRVDQKRTKGKRDGRLHVTLSPAYGFYRYRLDFPDEAACARAADAMLEHRSYKAPQQIKLRVCSWNMGNALPQEDLTPWLGGDADVYAVGVQEARYSAEGAPVLHPLTTLHPLPCCTLHARTAPPLARLPAPCQASYKLSKELHDTHKSCTEHWVNMATQACAGGGLHQVGHISMGQIHLLVLCKPALVESVSEVETGSVSLGDHVQPDRHCNLQPHAPQPAPRLVTACTLRRCRRAWAAWAPTRAGSPSPSACARRTCASSTRTSPRTRARTTCQA